MGGNVNVLDRQNETVDRTIETSRGGLTTRGASIGYSTTTTETTKATSTSVGSSITSGGNTNVTAGGSANVRGSDIAAGGNLNVNAKDINVTAGHEHDHRDESYGRQTFSGVGVYANKDSTGWEAINENTTTSTDGEQPARRARRR